MELFCNFWLSSEVASAASDERMTLWKSKGQLISHVAHQTNKIVIMLLKGWEALKHVATGGVEWGEMVGCHWCLSFLFFLTKPMWRDWLERRGITLFESFGQKKHSARHWCFSHLMNSICRELTNQIAAKCYSTCHQVTHEIHIN